MKFSMANMTPRRKACFPPRRTFTELAQEFGLTPGQLRGEMRFSPVPVPKPELIHHSNAGRNTWYDPHEMRRWWKAHNEAKAAKELQA